MPGERMSCLRPGIFLDRDGTIIVDHGYVGSVDRVDFIDGAPEAIAGFNRAGIPVAVVTNQAGVARGLYGLDGVRRVHRHIAEHLAEYGARIDLFLYCPYHPDGVIEGFARTSEDRKPRPGMAKAAAAALNLDLTAPGSWATGPRTSAWPRRWAHRPSTWERTAASARASGRSPAWRPRPRSSSSVSRHDFYS